MKTIVVNELEGVTVFDMYMLDLTNHRVLDCIGCWSCWWKTPGRCAFTDLDEFYHEYVNADKVIFFCKVVKGFVSGNVKSLFDRMSPLFLPYTTIATGESMHIPRYKKYPEIEFYYQGEFAGSEGQKVYENYIHRVFYQFYSKKITVAPLAEYQQKGAWE